MEANLSISYMFEIVFTLTLSFAKNRMIGFKLLPFTIVKALLHCRLGPSVGIPILDL